MDNRINGHTPLPYHLKGILICSSDGNPVMRHGGVEGMEATAQFIVTACNSYYPMREALREAAEMLENIADTCDRWARNHAKGAGLRIRSRRMWLWQRGSPQSISSPRRPRRSERRCVMTQQTNFEGRQQMSNRIDDIVDDIKTRIIDNLMDSLADAKFAELTAAEAGELVRRVYSIRRSVESETFSPFEASADLIAIVKRICQRGKRFGGTHCYPVESRCRHWPTRSHSVMSLKVSACGLGGGRPMALADWHHVKFEWEDNEHPDKPVQWALEELAEFTWEAIDCVGGKDIYGWGNQVGSVRLRVELTGMGVPAIPGKVYGQWVNRTDENDPRDGAVVPFTATLQAGPQHAELAVDGSEWLCIVYRIAGDFN